MFKFLLVIGIFLAGIYLGYQYTEGTNADDVIEKIPVIIRPAEDICQHKAQVEAATYYTEIEPDSEKANEIYYKVYKECMKLGANELDRDLIKR